MGGEQDGAGVEVTILRFVGHALWVLLPVISFGLLAWLPATQAYWRVRTIGWLITMLALMLGTAGWTVGIFALHPGLIVLLFMSVPGGVAAAVLGRKVVFGTKGSTDAAVQAVLDDRRRRGEARAIAERDPAMALELGIGRPDRPSTYDDGGLVDLNNVSPEGIAGTLGWSREAAESLVADREARGGYASLTEVGALSDVDPRLLEHYADRIVLLPFRPSDRLR